MALRISDELRAKMNMALLASDHGAPLLVEATLPDEHRGMLSGLRASAERTIDEVTKNDTRRPNIYFDFVEDNEFNAFATSMGSDYFILVNTRVVVSIPALFRNLLSLPQFASHIGDPSLETRPPITTVPIGMHESRFIDAMSHVERLPKCPIRERAAARFSQTALNFLLLHELGHIRNGHLPFLFSGTDTMPMLPEAELKPPDDRNMLAEHTFENDANSHAVVHGVNAVIRLTRTTTPAPGDPLDALYATPEHTLYAYLLPVYTLLRALGRTPDWSHEEIWKSSHPPMAIRQYLLTALVSAHLARPGFNFASPEKPFEIARGVIMDVEQGFSILTGVTPNLKDFGLAAEYWRRGYGRQLTEFWITAYPRLEQLKLGGRLAPPEPWRDGPDDAMP